ncbi:WD repeat domain 62 isoform X4 [Rhynchophorus ferrugineus]|uniref:WD repeat domain 62 isoform X4 n=1 Tax=Rhynchophorus ferrugineus TaxID=354439 RepID=UPI003FCE9F6F
MCLKKQNSMSFNQVKLERVLGVTVSSNAALATDNNGIIAYPAGCTVVLFNIRTEQQNHIINSSRKTITSLAYSSCGRYIVTGECGHQPAVRVWDLQADTQSLYPGLAPQPQQVAEFVGHKYGVNCVAFSPSNKYVVSVGTQHDMIVNVWDWKNNIKVASNKVSTKVKAIAFADNGSYFVTVGNRHVKFWFLETGKNKYKEAVPLMGRSAILGEQRNNYFCDVACGKGECGDSTYAITRSGLLCEFNNRRLLDKWVELRTTSANCITVGQTHIFVGCAEGIIRCFDPATLRFITTLPRCHYLGVDVALGTSIQHMATPLQDAKYPDTVAITFDEPNNKLTAVYNDHSIYIWDVCNIRRVGKSCSFLYHSACIWGVEMAPTNSGLPPGSFLTCSSDDTIRVWTLDKMNDKNSRGMYQQNIYSNELLKVVYVDKDLSYIKDLDISGTVSTEKQPDQTSYDGKNGVRCIKVSPNGKHLASGDRSGNIRIHDIAQMKEQFKIEAHDSEVLCLEYSASDLSYNLLASASRDRLIHVFDTNNGYEFVQTLDDHSSSITAVRFLNHSNNIQMISCGADKSLIFRSLGEFGGKAQFVRDHNATGKTTLYDMEVDTGQKHVLTACQDRNVRIYNVHTGKHTKTFKGSTGDDGTLIKVVLDRSGIYLATSCTDKSLSVYDYYSGECMATMCGHSELATGLRFTNDCRRLVSASGDGCIFIWRIPHDMVITMQARLSQQAIRQGKMLETEIFNETSNFELYEGISTADANYRFSIGQLPQWAKKQFTEESSQPTSLTKGVAAPKGRWAKRAETSLGVQTFYSSNPLPFPNLDRRPDSDGSKDSSLDSGTEIKMYQETKNEAMTITTKVTPNITIRDRNRRGIMTDDSAIGDVESTAHEGDLDSDTDYRHKPLYYPTLADSPSGSEFTVTNIDADELRKSQRKKKTPQIVIQPTTTGTYDSEDDDDDASTPSGENTDRNPMSLFSVSSESLEQLGIRERYLQSTFESMSGAEAELLTPSNKSSFSSKFLTNGNRNIEAINAVKQTKLDPEAIRKRQELNKRIAETKKKLESVGHGSPLKYSQSIHDLSHIPERDKWSKKQVYLDDTSSPESSLRRSCSLSDLSMQKASNIAKRKPEQTGKKPAPPARITPRYVKNNSMMRSKSSVVLNQHSDSENDSQDKKMSRLMRPTISSHNKISQKSLQSRKKQSYSTSNLNQVGIDNVSTSDDEETVKKPQVPPRMSRQQSFENGQSGKRHTNNKDQKRASRHSIHFDDTLTNEDLDISSESMDLSSIEFSNQLCENVSKQLVKTADNVVKIYQKLKESEETGDVQPETLDCMKMSIIKTYKVVHECIFNEFKQNNGNIDVNQTDAIKKLNDLVSKGSTGSGSVIDLMQQYSDILLDMMQQKIHSANI